ncbi:MAG: hypothetical protein IJ681_00465 [Bacteroidales bacterium]|nr:hypothetical protein [Bacteroidales bacterium]
MSKETLILQKPLKVNGEDLTELEYDLEAISIEHIARAEGEKTKLLGKNAAAGVKVAQADYLLHILIGEQAIIACNPKISTEDFKRVSGYDIVQIAAIGTRFFIPPTSPQEKPSEKSPVGIVVNSTAQ